MDILRYGWTLCWTELALPIRDIFCETALQNPRNNDVEIKVTLEDTKRASVLLIRKLFLLMQNLDVLPNNVYLTMKLYYYDDSKCV